MMHLPLWGYGCHILFEMGWKSETVRKITFDGFSAAHARILTACYGDRSYIDAVLRNELKIEPKCRLLQTYWDIGATLWDLGYDDGVAYMEKAIGLEDRKDYKNNLMLIFCLRLNNRTVESKKHEFLKELVDDMPEDTNVKSLLVRAYIDAGRFNDANKLIEELTTAEPPEVYGHLWAELYFAQKDFKAASDAFDKYEISKSLYFLTAQYDYKKALAYYYSNQIDKCRKQALKIRRRKKWDRFYRLDDLENNGISRESFIDEIINFATRDNYFFDRDRINHHCRMLGCILWAWIRRHPYLAITILVIVIFLLLRVFAPATRLITRKTLPIL